MRCVNGPYIAPLHVWVALIVPGCVNCEVLLASLV